MTTYLTTAAVALVVAAQAVFAPASCCLLRAALSGGKACCHVAAVAVEDAPRACCHRQTAKAELAVGAGVPAPAAGECLICSAGPKVVSNDRVAAPDVDAGPLFASPVLPETVAVSPASVERVADEPFHRTAMAACAWLCVWRK